MKILWTVCLAILAMVSPACADSLELFFNDESAEIGYDHPLVEDDYGLSVVNGRFLYNDQEDTVLGSLGFDFLGEPGNVPGLELGAGARLYGGSTDENQDILALGVGGRVDYAPPALGGVGMGFQAFYAPKIFSLLDTERILETAFRLTYAITPRVRLGVEYQRIRSDFEARGDWTIDEGLRLGFQARF